MELGGEDQADEKYHDGREWRRRGERFQEGAMSRARGGRLPVLPLVLIAAGVVGLWAVGLGRGLPPGPAGRFPGGFSPAAGRAPRDAAPLSLGQAAGRVREYLAAMGEADLAPAEVIEFSNHFYASVRETGTGRYAFELLVDPSSGAIAPGPGPNLLWNRKYGPWGERRDARLPAGEPMRVSAQEARERALRALRAWRAGDGVGEPGAFYGYYTLEVLRDGAVTGLLSVNGTNGDVLAAYLARPVHPHGGEGRGRIMMHGWGWGYFGGGNWMGWLGPILMLVFWALVIAGVVLLIRWLVAQGRSAGGTGGGRSPMDILKERYARGEITREQFERMREDLK